MLVSPISKLPVPKLVTSIESNCNVCNPVKELVVSELCKIKPPDCGACSERYPCRHAADGGVCAVAGAAEAYVQPLGRWMTVAAVAPRRAAGP